MQLCSTFSNRRFWWNVLLCPWHTHHQHDQHHIHGRPWPRGSPTHLSSPDPTEGTAWPSFVLLEHQVADLVAVVGSEQVEVVLRGSEAERGRGAARRWRRERARPGRRSPVAAGPSAGGPPLAGGGGAERGRGATRRWWRGRARPGRRSSVAAGPSVDGAPLAGGLGRTGWSRGERRRE